MREWYVNFKGRWQNPLVSFDTNAHMVPPPLHEGVTACEQLRKPTDTPGTILKALQCHHLQAMDRHYPPCPTRTITACPPHLHPHRNQPLLKTFLHVPTSFGLLAPSLDTTSVSQKTPPNPHPHLHPACARRRSLSGRAHPIHRLR
jgi:hypothetical protein